MFAWTLLVLSGLGLLVIFLRRAWHTKKDLVFQENLMEEEQAAEAEATMEEEGDEESGGGSGKLSFAEEGQTRLRRGGSIRKTFLKADMLLKRGEFDEAEQLYKGILDADPNNLDALGKLGLLYMKKGDFSQAELQFSMLLNLKKDPTYFSNLGAALYQQKRLLEAAESYENAVALDDKRAARLESLAQIYYELGNDEKALFYFEKASARKPKDSGLKLIVADYYERQQRMPEARDVLERALEADPYNKEIKAKLKSLSK